MPRTKTPKRTKNPLTGRYTSADGAITVDVDPWPEPGVHYWSKSCAETAMNCWKAFEYKYRHFRTAKGASESLALGSIAHAGLNDVWRGKAQWWRGLYREACGYPVSEDVPGYIRDKALGMVSAYQEYYSPEEGDLVEVPLYCRINGLPVQAHFDVGLWKSRYTLEHKTAGRYPERTKATKLATDVQARLYTLLSEIVLKSDGVIYDTIVGPKLTHTRSETRSQYANRIRNRLLSQPEKHFHRITLRRPDYKATVEQLQSLVETAKHFDLVKLYPRSMRVNSCFEWRRACDYLPVCSGSTTLENDDLYETRRRSGRGTEDAG